MEKIKVFDSGNIFNIRKNIGSKERILQEDMKRFILFSIDFETDKIGVDLNVKKIPMNAIVTSIMDFVSVGDKFEIIKIDEWDEKEENNLVSGIYQYWNIQIKFLKKNIYFLL